MPTEQRCLQSWTSCKEGGNNADRRRRLKVLKRQLVVSPKPRVAMATRHMHRSPLHLPHLSPQAPSPSIPSLRCDLLLAAPVSRADVKNRTVSGHPYFIAKHKRTTSQIESTRASWRGWKPLSHAALMARLLLKMRWNISARVAGGGDDFQALVGGGVMTWWANAVTHRRPR